MVTKFKIILNISTYMTYLNVLILYLVTSVIKRSTLKYFYCRIIAMDKLHNEFLQYMLIN
jgi:hypothetical protein